MTIGVIITTGPENGGTFFYSLSVLNALRDYAKEHSIVVFYDNEYFPVHLYSKKNWVLHHYHAKDSFFIKLARFLSLSGIKAFRAPSRGRHSAMLNYKLDIVICPSTSLAAWWCGVPYIVAIHDIWHRYNLPGTSFLIEPFRDKQWKIAALNAEIILAESELGKSEIISAYKVPESKILILPTGPAPFIWNQDLSRMTQAKVKYRIEYPFVFYPGGFSPAKNQLRIIEALALIKHQHNIQIHAILAGPRNAYTEEILQVADSLGIRDLIHTTGLVPDEDMPYLYKSALALVMASYIGPTNMPIWEAFAAGCPVISSNAGEMPDQVGDAGILFDPSDSTQLSILIQKVFLDSEFRREMIVRGNKRIEHVKPENWAKNLLSIIEEASGSI